MFQHSEWVEVLLMPRSIPLGGPVPTGGHLQQHRMDVVVLATPAVAQEMLDLVFGYKFYRILYDSKYHVKL